MLHCKYEYCKKWKNYSLLTAILKKKYEHCFAFFCREDWQCIRERVIQEYIAFKGGQLPYCRHMDVATLRVSRLRKTLPDPSLSTEEEMKCADFSSGLMNNLLKMRLKDYLHCIGLRKKGHLYISAIPPG